MKVLTYIAMGYVAFVIWLVATVLYRLRDATDRDQDEYFWGQP